jgi:hypothetical protein
VNIVDFQGNVLDNSFANALPPSANNPVIISNLNPVQNLLVPYWDHRSNTSFLPSFLPVASLNQEVKKYSNSLYYMNL